MFLAEYRLKMLDDFNKSQKKAITHIEGPLLVVSGAGTGKTHVLTGKILYLLLEKKVPSEQILALTFTDKAAEEMSSRVDAALPLGHGEIQIRTFHAFADQILKERCHEIGLGLDYKILSEADLWMFLKKHVLNFKLMYFRSLTNPQKFLHALSQYFNRLMDEDITPDSYLHFCDQLIGKASDEAEREYAEKQLELARAYETYLHLLVSNASMDFGSLIYFANRLFEKRPSVLAEYQKRFRYFLVDEFQDTNFAQNKLIMILSGKSRNITVVGDDDQSIYKWRGASLTNIQYFKKNFPQAASVVLNENYRSSQNILDLAYNIIQKNNPNRLEVSQSVNKKLISAVKKTEKPAQIYHFATLSEEVEFVVSKAKDSLRKKLDTAILVRTNALATPFLEYLKKEKLPYQHFAPSALFSKSGVKDCIAVLRVIADPWDDIALFRCLSFPIWGIPMKNLLEVTKTARSGNLYMFNLLSGKVLDKAKKTIHGLIEFSRDHSVSEVLGKFISENEYLNSVTDEILVDIGNFSEKVKNFENAHNEKSVTDFLQYVQLVEEIGEPRDVKEFLDRDSIKILTIHGSKGLEFDSVFIPGMSSGKFPGISRREPFEIPQELIPESLPSGDIHIEEERRLFYVAITRAREFLTLTYSDNYDGKKQWKVSPFISEAISTGKAILLNSRDKNEIHHEQSSFELKIKRSNNVASGTLPKLSYSQLDCFETCPLKYKYRYLQNIPTVMPSIVNFGSSIHNTLKEFYEELQKHPMKITEDLWPQLKRLYEKNWIAKGYEDRTMQEEQKKIGLMMLERFYAKEKEVFTIPAFLEKSFKLKINDIILTGRIDRIDRLSDGTYEVIDYKTGSTEKKLDKDLQLSIYALACKEDLKINVSKLSLYFLESMEKVSTVRSEDSLLECKNEIIQFANEIASSNYSPTPGFHCGWCEYRLICPVAAPVVR